MARSDDDTWDLASSVGATATMVAAGRALASKDARGLINDPFAEPLVEAVGVDFFIQQVRGEVDVTSMDPSAQAFVQMMVDGTAVRTKYFDEYFADAVHRGIRQVVILASGLDARAYRLPWPDGTTLYEIDQPQVLAFKTAALSDLGAEPTTERRSVAVDLRGDWAAALRAAGFDAGRPTAWSAEGLLQYLPPEAQHLLLDTITGLSAAGSSIAADYNDATADAGDATADDISQAWHEKGFTLDVPSLMPTGGRGDAASHLAALGWTLSRRSVDELFAAYGIERVRAAANHPLDKAVYVSGTLRRPPSVSP